MLAVVVKGSFSEASEIIHDANSQADALEFRIDLFENLDFSQIAKLKKNAKLPVIFTLREFTETTLELLKLNPDYLDFEYGKDLHLISKIRKTYPKLSLICSYHDYEKTPNDLSEILKRMQHTSVDIYKLAFYAQNSLDSLRMLLFVQDERKRGVKLAGMCMGESGVITRILAPVVDSLITYAPLEKSGETAPGQLTLAELKKIYHFYQINTETSLYALIGNPVDKSIGHLVHNHLFNLLDKNAVYVKISISSNELSEFFHLIKRLPFKGFSVTMPLKQVINNLLDSDTKNATNTLYYENKNWSGFNTDGSGALDAIEERSAVKGKKLTILGAGGTAKAIAFEAVKRGGEVTIVNRSLKRALFAKELGCRKASLSDWEKSPKAYDILIQATSVGMAPNFSDCIIKEASILSKSLVFDAIFNPKETAFLKLAKKRHCEVIYGFEMFARQALEQIEIWFGPLSNKENLLLEINQIYQKANL